MLRIIVLQIFIITNLLSSNCILNFGKTICDDFTFTNNIIIKSPLSKDILENKLQKEVKQLAFLNKANIYLISSNNLLEEIKILRQKDYILYAQADILQKTNKNNHKPFFSNLEIFTKNNAKEINIAIIDDGFDFKDKALRNINLKFQYDLETKTLDALPKNKLDTHGTNILKIISSLAYQSNIIALRQTSNLSSDIILAFTLAHKLRADIINCSWNSPLLLQPVYDVIYDLSTKKSTYVVFSAGNENKELQKLTTEASIPEVISIGNNQKYSNYGALVDFKIDEKTDIKIGGTSASAAKFSALLALKLSSNTNKTKKEILSELKQELKND